MSCSPVTISLPDVNVWLSLVAQGHLHHERAKAWFETQQDASVAFCRITQMGLLRLLTNASVMMGGRKTISHAWDVVGELSRDRRVIFAGEPAGIEFIWRELMTHASVGPSSWTDGYLAAFGRAPSAALVTFDHGFGRWADLQVTLLSSPALPGGI